MSLINDALRRAKQAQQQASPAPTHDTQHFRPVDPASQKARHGVGLLLPALLAAMALLGLLLVWELSRSGALTNSPTANTSLSAAARALPVSSAPAAAQEGVSPGSDTPVAGSPAEASKPVSAQNTAVPEPGASPTASATTNTGPTVAGQSDTNHGGITEPVVPAPVPLKLQSIVYNPRRPSAMINGRIIFVGDHLREYRVLAIRKDEVMLAGAGQTNVLSLEP